MLVCVCVCVCFVCQLSQRDLPFVAVLDVGGMTPLLHRDMDPKPSALGGASCCTGIGGGVDLPQFRVIGMVEVLQTTHHSGASTDQRTQLSYQIESCRDRL